jgi:hypothetical protein
MTSRRPGAVAPEERLDEVIADTAPIIESIEFHPG